MITPSFIHWSGEDETGECLGMHTVLGGGADRVLHVTESKGRMHCREMSREDKAIALDSLGMHGQLVERERRAGVCGFRRRGAEKESALCEEA